MRNTICVLQLRVVSQCNGSVRVVNGALATDFFSFGKMMFLLKLLVKKCFKIVAFPLWRRDPVLELQFLVFFKVL